MPKASQSMKISFAIAYVIGLAVSVIFAALDPYTGFYFVNWQLPGAAVAYFYWGMLGGSTASGVVIMCLVNAFMYSVPPLVVIRSIVALRRKTTE